ncbi:MAG: RagB/SusD family nutrient uptake outer membrane protein [Bacteroidales bacterium]|nr:RagB/SusD family nutrient uptake outer membrane protein [Bacteroidales bacterium]
MRNKLLIFFIPLSLFLTVSCSDKGFLDETVTTDLNREAVFSDSTYTAGFLNEIYRQIGFDTDPDRFSITAFGWKTSFGGLQTACDEARFKRSSTITTDVMFATGTINPILVSKDAWQNCYANIRRVNVFLKYVDKSPIVDKIKNQYKAEARFLRAWYYGILLRHYGGVPLIGDAVYDVNDDIKMTRDSYEHCVNYIVSECDAIISSNVLPKRRMGRDYGRISEAACRALKARVLLYAASPLYNGIEDKYAPTEEYKKLLGYPVYDKERWRLAYEAARDVIAMNEYKLFKWDQTGDANSDNSTPEPGWGFYAVTSMASDFANFTQSKDGEVFKDGAFCEIILDKTAAKGNARERLFGPPTSGGGGEGGYIYKELTDAFPMIDGKPIGQSKYTYNVFNPNANRDPRFSNSVLYDGGYFCTGVSAYTPIKISQGVGATLDAVHVGTPTGFYVKKTVSRATCGNSFIGVPQSRPLIRYAEILLNYAEAANEYYGPDYSDQYTSVYDALKTIRSRAGIEAGDDGMYGLKQNMTQDEMREAIRLERRIELAFEGFRFFDVRRWKIAEQTDNKTMHGLEITVNADGTKSSSEFEVAKHIFRPAMYFWPIPYDEVTKSNSLLQNPFYSTDNN